MGVVVDPEQLMSAFTEILVERAKDDFELEIRADIFRDFSRDCIELRALILDTSESSKYPKSDFSKPFVKTFDEETFMNDTVAQLEQSLNELHKYFQDHDLVKEQQQQQQEQEHLAEEQTTPAEIFL